MRSLLLVALVNVPGLAAEIDFAHDIVPVLRQHCGECHTGAQKKGGLSLNTRESLLAGGESGPAVVSGKSGASELVRRVLSTDPDLRMPPEGPRVPAEKVALLKKWIDAGALWEQGFRFGPRGYEPPLAPRRPELPAAVDGRENPIDRLVDHYLTQRKLPRPATLDDEAFLRRVQLDLIGLLPTVDERAAFLADSGRDKRERLVQRLLARDVDYAEHWLSFWNDLLRNDYSGTGFITGGRRQISKWLYDALVANKPYDQLARDLLAPPTPESAGFIQGIRWRGDVSAGQTVEVQFAQSVGQSFLGINLKCASCHDSFIDRWTLEESYGLAAVYSSQPLAIHRCDQPTGKKAQAAWLFPELGRIEPTAPQSERLKQLAALMTHRDNGRFTRTIVNRLWHRLMGRGLVHPTDAMQTEPWHADLLDYLAEHLADSGYDLKRTLALIAASQAYQSPSQRLTRDTDARDYVYAGPRAKRLTAEQFVDAVWQLTDSAPSRFDAPVVRGKTQAPTGASRLTAQWIWSRREANNSPGGETVVFRHRWQQAAPPTQAVAAISCDNSYVLYVNRQRVHAGETWERPDRVVLTSRLKAGENELLIVAKNGAAVPNPAGLICETRLFRADGTFETLGTGASWQWSAKQPAANGKYATEPDDWQPAVPVALPEIWAAVQPELSAALAPVVGANAMVRASLLKSDFLMRALGRPNRDQIVSVRPSELSTLEAIDLANGQTLADTLARGATKLVARPWKSPDEFGEWLFRFALGRDPSTEERLELSAVLGDKLTESAVQDLLWSVVMLPEFQFVR